MFFFLKKTLVIDTPPFEITEFGWGEFEIAVSVHFIDPNEAAVMFIHPLRLHSDCKHQHLFH